MRSRLRGLIAAIAITSGLWLAPAHAQDVSPESLAASRALMAAAKSDQALDQVIAMFIPQISAMLERANPEHGTAIRKILDEMMLPEMRKSIPEAIEEAAVIYARNFTLEELNEVTAFYQSPVGQKFLERQPALMAELAQLGQAWGQRTALKVLRDLAPKLKEQGIEVPI